jgi:hypothetical protein
MNSLKKITIYVVLVATAACSFFNKTPENQGKAIARVGNDFLYEEDIKTLITSGITLQDSALVVNNYINNWAASKLLVEKAKINLSEEKQSELNKLVETYMADLYARACKEALVAKSIDTTVSKNQLQQYYEANKENFKLNEELLKLQYIQLPVAFSNKDVIVQKFRNQTDANKKYLDSVAIQFTSYHLNDSVWVRASQVFNKISAINKENKEKYLKKSQFFELNDSLGVYLVKINDVLLRNEIAPLLYIQPTVQQIIINQRKLDFMKNLEKDILDQAIKKKDFEVYE